MARLVPQPGQNTSSHGVPASIAAGSWATTACHGGNGLWLGRTCPSHIWEALQAKVLTKDEARRIAVNVARWRRQQAGRSRADGSSVCYRTINTGTLPSARTSDVWLPNHSFLMPRRP